MIEDIVREIEVGGIYYGPVTRIASYGAFVDLGNGREGLLHISKIAKGTGEVELLNIKLDEDKILQLVKKEGFYKAYHMNKKSWISIILNDTLNNKEIFELIDESYNLINDKK